jgi:hypothetical protein
VVYIHLDLLLCALHVCVCALTKFISWQLADCCWRCWLSRHTEAEIMYQKYHIATDDTSGLQINRLFWLHAVVDQHVGVCFGFTWLLINMGV